MKKKVDSSDLRLNHSHFREYLEIFKHFVKLAFFVFLPWLVDPVLSPSEIPQYLSVAQLFTCSSGA